MELPVGGRPNHIQTPESCGPKLHRSPEKTQPKSQPTLACSQLCPSFQNPSLKAYLCICIYIYTQLQPQREAPYKPRTVPSMRRLWKHGVMKVSNSGSKSLHHPHRQSSRQFGGLDMFHADAGVYTCLWGTLLCGSRSKPPLRRPKEEAEKLHKISSWGQWGCRLLGSDQGSTTRGCAYKSYLVSFVAAK